MEETVIRASIITAVFNRAGTIGDCLRSVASQSHGDIDHIIVDGGSEDGTLEELEGNRHPRMELVSEPDNGIYDALLELAPGEFRVIAHPSCFRHEVSATFHGRDIFSPTAAALATGLEFEEVGPTFAGVTHLPDLPLDLAENEANGVVMQIDHFGNVISNIPVAKLGFKPHHWVFPERGGTPVTARVGKSYAEVEIGELLILTSSSGYVELAANRMSAAQIVSAVSGEPLTIRARVKD